MTLFDTISEDIKKSMLARDHARTETLRGIKKEFLEAKTAKGASGELDDAQAMKIIAKLVKQREESAEIYNTNGRPELAETELQQAEFMREYLPKQMSEEEITEHLKKLIADLGITDIKGMGRVIGTANKQLAGRAEGKMIADLTKKLLSE